MINNDRRTFLTNEKLRLDQYSSYDLAVTMLLTLVRINYNYSDAVPLVIGDSVNPDMSAFEGTHPELIVGVYELPSFNTTY